MISNYLAISDNAITVDSEADLEFLLNNIDLAGVDWQVMAKGGYFTLVGKAGGPVIPPEVAAVLARYSALTQQETDAITKFVSNELQALGNNWAKINDFFCWALNATDWLIGMREKTATNTGAVTRSDEGAVFDGTGQRLNTVFNAGSEGNTTDSNRQYGAYLVSRAAAQPNNPAMFFETSGTGAGVIRTAGSPDNAVNWSANSALVTIVEKLRAGAYTVARLDVGNESIQLNGVPFQPVARAVQAGASPMILGARDSGAFGFEGTIATAMIGQAAGFQQVVHHTNQLELLIDLGVFINPVLARYTGLSATETTAITNFVNALARVGIWQQMDEYFCFSLVNTPANALIGMKEKTGTGGGAFSIAGMLNTQNVHQFNTQFSPLNDGKNYQQNDALAGGRYSDLRFLGGQLNIWNTSAQVQLFDNAGAGTHRINARFTSALTIPIQSNGAYVQTRTAAAVQTLYRNGQVVPTTSQPASIPPPATPLAIVGSINGGNCLWQSAVIGGAFNPAQFYDIETEFLIELGVFVTPVLARYTGLTQTEIDAITVYVNNEVRNGNWFKTDEFFCFSLAGANALIGMKQATATNNGATPITIQGAAFNGTNQTIFTNVNLATQVSSYKAADALQGGMVIDFGGAAVDSFLSGVVSGGTNVAMRNRANGYNIAMNQAATNVFPQFDRKASMIMGGKEVVNRTLFFQDGVQVANVAHSAGNVIPNQAAGIALGGRNNDGTPDLFRQCGFATYHIGARIDFDTAANYNNQIALLTALGVTLP